MANECAHLEKLERPGRSEVDPKSEGCAECLAAGGEWVHLRLCMSCGHVGCCDSSPGRHATKHFHTTKHPVIKSYEPGETWAYCYAHESQVDPIPAFEIESPAEHINPPI